MSDLVKCHSGSEYAERPVSLFYQEQWLEIKDILERRRNPDDKCFRVRTTDDQVFKLFYSEATDEWRIYPL